MKVIESQGNQITTQSFGSPTDPAILLVMGATASMLGWPDRFCDTLVKHGLYVIRFDHRDTGQSTTRPFGQIDYTVEDMAADTLAILDAYGLSRAHVMGMSLGGLISQMIALQHPTRILSLTLISSEPLGWDGLPLPYISDEFLDHFRTIDTLDWTNKNAVADFLLRSEELSTGTGQDFDEPHTRSRIEQILARTESPASMFNHGRVTTKQDWAGKFHNITCPVLVIHGEEDPILPVANGQALACGIAGSELLILPEIGHELPPSTFQIIADRVASHTQRLAK